MPFNLSSCVIAKELYSPPILNTFPPELKVITFCLLFAALIAGLNLVSNTKSEWISSLNMMTLCSWAIRINVSNS